jgi:cathepsin L
MKLVLFVALLVFAQADVTRQLFKNFQVEFGKTYATEAEAEHRYRIFAENLIRIDRMNNAHALAHGNEPFGITLFADLTHEEFSSKYLMKNLPPYQPAVNATLLEDVPAPQAVVDWRNQGVVTAVKDQGQCGSCWAHSADEAVESFFALKYGKASLTVGSVQQVTSCTYSYNGCNGGWPYDGYTAGIEARSGLETNAMLPYSTQTYNGNAPPCPLTNGKATSPFTDDTGYKSLAKGQLLNAMNSIGPISVCVAAESWQFYQAGQVLSSCPGSVDHCVQAVGYNQISSTNEYWIVRNSWGTGWGNAGYIWLDMTQNNGDICLIQDYMTYPTIS